MLRYEEIVKIINDSSAINTDKVVIRQTENLLVKNLLDRKPIKVITGIRRSGKSFILKRIYQKLSEQNIPSQNILFINFENDLLIDYLNVVDLRKIVETFKSRGDVGKRFYLFLDEIHYIQGWEKYIRTLYDSTDDEIYLTGSNSSLLSGEFATAIGGRLMEYKIQPLTLAEVLQYYKFDYKDIFKLEKNKAQYQNICNAFLEFGGFPEILDLEVDQKLNYRNSLLDKIMLIDIIQRHSLGKPQFLKDIYFYVERNVGSIINYSAIAANSGLSDKTVERYLSLLLDSFIIYSLPKLEWKTKKIFETQQKMYLADNLFTKSSIESRRLENAVFGFLLSKYGLKNMYFLRDERGHEIDFVIKQKNYYICIQVCWKLNDKNAKREYRSLQNLQKYRTAEELKGDRFLIIYYEDTRKNKVKAPLISAINIFEFLLS